VDLYPAIDLRAGRVVRLSQGEAGRETRYGDDPVAQAERFADAGARWIHVVDLDRAFGTGDNHRAVAAITRALAGRVQIQTGGGLRSLDAVRAVLDLGVRRAVLGTAAVTEPALVPQAVTLAGPGRLAVGLDTRDGKVAIRGWVETSPLLVVDVCRRVVADGAGTIIYTDVARDGMLAGPDLDGARVLQAVGASVIASGGVATIADLRAVREAGLAGAIVGRALYEARFTLEDALAAVR